ncbi:MAG: helix-turn-helix transcriptional regulator [Ruminiclostridium sp.]|nr:helix-turn-helix transcriptional regulator [Ruminiclostridium sp.]
MQEVIKDLRMSKGISSHKELAKELEKYADRYGVTVGKSTLQKLEETDSSKDAYKTNVGYKAFLALADFYGVSVDYLFGRTDSMTPDEKTRAAIEITGIKESSIEMLKCQYAKSKDTGDDSFQIVSLFLHSVCFYEAMNHIMKYIVADTITPSLEQIYAYLEPAFQKQTSSEKLSKETTAIISAFRDFAGKYTEGFRLFNKFESYPDVSVKNTLDSAKNYRDFQYHAAFRALEELTESVKKWWQDSNNSVNYIEEFLKNIEARSDITSETKEKMKDALDKKEGD